MKIEHLEWDSEFFQKKIGKVVIEEFKYDQFISLLEEAKLHEYELLYVFTPESFFIDDQTIIHTGGKLVDRKVLYNQEFQNGYCNPEKVLEYTSPELSNELESLAYISGKYSRFYLDKDFARGDFYRLYLTWITRSIKKELADKVYVIKEDKKLVGMVTLKQDKSGGEIGLFAVFEYARGKGYGTQLIDACKKALSENEIYSLKVPTQLANRNACLFYERCGFRKTSITNIYHFWL